MLWGRLFAEPVVQAIGCKKEANAGYGLHFMGVMDYSFLHRQAKGFAPTEQDSRTELSVSATGGPACRSTLRQYII